MLATETKHRHTVIKMTPYEWALVADNPHQRDTQERARRASYLREPSPTHAVVYAAETENGDRYKLDGHTRSYLWQHGEVATPPFLHVHLFHVSGIEEVKSLYDHFDNAKAATTTADKVFGGFRDCGFIPSSALLKKCTIRSVLTICGGGRDPYAAVASMFGELRTVDGFRFNPSLFPAGILSACILTIRRHGNECFEFWQRYNDKMGQCQDGFSDGVDALLKLVEARRASRTLTGTQNSVDIAGRALACAEGYLAGKTFRIAPRPLSVADYVKACKAARADLSDL